MTRKIFGLVMAVALSCGAIIVPRAESAGIPDAAAAETPVRPGGFEREGFFWTVEGRENRVYLLGSVHVLKAEDYPLPPGLETIYRLIGKVVFESDIKAAEEPGFIFQQAARMMYPPGETLSGNISEGTLKLLEERLSDTALIGELMPLWIAERFQPWALAMTLSVAALERLGYDSRAGVDRHFLRRAVNDGKEKGHLEAPDAVIDFLAGLDRAAQERMLENTLRDLEKIESKTAEMISAWKAGDAERMERITAREFEASPEIYEGMLARRNRQWLPLVEAFLEEEQDVLVIVGAGHLVGRDNLVSLLEEKGYRAEIAGFREAPGEEPVPDSPRPLQEKI